MNSEVKKTLLPIDLIKVVAIINMIVLHCFLFLNRITHSQINATASDSMIKIVLFHCLNNLMLPIAAGYMLFDNLEKYIQNGVIRNFPFKKNMKIWLSIALLESIKNSICFDLSYFFRVDVLHFIVLSIFFIYLILNYLNIYWLFGITLMFLTLGFIPFFQHLPISNYLLFPNDAINMLTMRIESLAFAILFSALTLFYKSLFEIKNKNINYFLNTLILLNFIFIFLYSSTHLYFYAQIHNLPISIFYQQGQFGGHIWPVFPWSALIFFGFIFNYSVKNYTFLKNNQLRNLFISLIGLVATNYLFFDNFINHFSKKYTFSSSFFRPDSGVIISSFMIFLSFYFLFDLIQTKFKFYSALLIEISESALIIYVINVILAWKLTPLILTIFGHRSANLILSAFVLFLTYCYLQGFNFLINKKVFLKIQRDKNE